MVPRPPAELVRFEEFGHAAGTPETPGNAERKACLSDPEGAPDEEDVFWNFLVFHCVVLFCSRWPADLQKPAILWIAPEEKLPHGILRGPQEGE